MYPILYDSGNLKYDRLGKGKLTDVTSFVVYEELNGEYSAEFTYPITGSRLDDLYAGGTVLVVCPSGPNAALSGEFFDIVSHSLTMDGLVTFKCQHFSRRLANSVHYGPVQKIINTVWTSSEPRDWNGISVVALSGSNFPAAFTPSVPKSVLACFIGEEESAVSIHGGAFTFYSNAGSSYNPNLGTILTVMWRQAGRGSDKGVQVRYGYNMMSFDREVDWMDTYNAVFPYWTDGNGTFVYATGYVVQPTTPITPVVCVPLDCSSAFQTQPTGAELVTYAQALLDAETPWVQSETITVDLLNGAEIDPHSPTICLGDTVHVYWNAAGITSDQKVISYKYDALAEKYVEFTLGTPETQFVAVTGEAVTAKGGGSVSGGGGVLYFTGVTCTAMTGDFATVSDGAITQNHVVVECVFTNPEYIKSDVSWTTADGSLTLNGTCSSATTVTIALAEKEN